MNNLNLLILATQHRKAAAECRRKGFKTIASVNYEMAALYEAKANTTLLLDNTDEE